MSSTVYPLPCFQQRRPSLFHPVFSSTSPLSFPFIIVILFHHIGRDSGTSYDSVQFTIAESQPIGTLIGTIPTLPGQRYRLNPDSTLFAIDDQTGDLTTKALLRSDSLPSNPVTILAQSLSIPPQHVVEIRITVLPINNYNPTFSPDHIDVKFSISDPIGSRVPLPSATDRDGGQSGTIVEYKIVSGDIGHRFSLVLVNNTTERLLLFLSNTVILNQSTTSNVLNISAKDGGMPSRFGYLSVNVSVSDSVTNSPVVVFNQSEYSVVVGRSLAIGSVVLQVWAKDSNPSSKIVYSLIDDSNAQFAIDADTGIIRSQKSLNCDGSCDAATISCQPNTCQLIVEAKDVTQAYPLTSRAFVSVMVWDESSDGPSIRFHEQGTSGQVVVDENKVVGAVVEAISVTDVDATLHLIHGNDAGDFRLQPTSISTLTLVLLAHTLDRSRTDLYNLTIEANSSTPPIRSSIAFLVIVVRSSNASSLVFDLPFYETRMSELSPVGSYVAAMSAHSRGSDVIVDARYSILTGNDVDWLDINPVTGLVTTKRILNVSLQSSLIQVTVEASFGGNVALANLTVAISAGNAEPPSFTHDPYYITLDEGGDPGEVIITVSATYGDNTGPVIFRLDPDTEDRYPGMFQVGETSGRLVTLKSLDREQFSSYKVKVIARNGWNPRMTSSASVMITLNDINDNRPMFEESFLVVSGLGSAADGGTALVQVQATDEDLGDWGTVRYSITSGGTDAVFLIDALTGWISIASSQVAMIPFTKSVYTLTVVARDLGGLQCPRPATVLILTNSSSLMSFTPSVGLSLLMVEDDGRLQVEVGRQIGQVQAAAGSRQPTAASISYLIADGDRYGVFGIDSNTGYIRTAQQVDRENCSFYSLTVIATTSSDYGITTVNITVTDVNDNVPSFPSSSAVVDVDEDIPVGQDIYVGRASDPDLGLNGTIRYSLTANSSSFVMIDEETGLLRLRTLLGSRTTDLLTVFIAAKDAGSPPLSAIQMLTIEVQIVSYHTPMFNQTEFRTTVNESHPVNKRFTCVMATVANDGIDGIVRHNITYGNSDGRIGIFPDGCLYIASALDRETTDMYALTVVASVGGKWGDRSATCLVVVVVVDANDNDPVFWNATNTYVIVEGSPAEDFAAMFIASDRDIGRNAELLFSIGSDTDGGFQIDTLSSLLTASRVFDREQVMRDTGGNVLHVTVVASDCGMMPRQGHASVAIVIADVNDNTPRFSNSFYEFIVREDATVGARIGNVTALDPDNGRNGSVSYSVVDGNDWGMFSVNSVSGELLLMRPVNRESSAPYVIVIEAKDDGLPVSLKSSVAVRVLVEDDGCPVWVEFPTQGLSISCRAEVGQLVGQVLAADGDTRNSSKVIYEMSGRGGKPAFVLEAATGRIYLSVRLNCSQPRTQMLMNVSARCPSPDSPYPLPMRWINSTLAINVLDINDHTPQFHASPFTFPLAEDSPSGRSIFTAQAFDEDLGSNAIFAYSISYQNPIGANFTVDRTSGLVVANGNVDKQVTDRFQLVVTATNVAMNTKRVSSQKRVEVFVVNGNDSIPEFWSADVVILERGLSSGSLLTTVKASAVDEWGTSGHIKYEIVNRTEDREMFLLDGVSGRLFAGRRFTSQPLLSVEIRATNLDHPSKSSSLQLTLLTPTASSDGPSFSQATYTAQIRENAPKGTAILTVSASYPANPSARMEYFTGNISSGGQIQKRFFEVDVKTGLITSTRPIDREDGFASFTFDVFTVDQSSGILGRRSSQVVISVVDENDNAPFFLSYVDRVEISESTPVGSVVGCIRATDPDSLDSSSSLLYTMTSASSSSAHLPLTIHPSTGDIVVTGQLSFEASSSYNLTVSVSDDLHTSEVKVVVTIVREADEILDFLLPYYVFDISEDTVLGSRVGRVSVLDLASNQAVTYGIVSQQATSAFSIDPVNGTLTLNSRLVSDQVDLFSLVVIATTNSVVTSSVLVYVNVVDVKDCSPVFSSSLYKTEVFENVEPGTSLIRVSSTDTEAGGCGHLRYTLKSGDHVTEFAIDADSGVLTVTKPFDRGVKSFYNLVIGVQDETNDGHYTPPRSATSMVSIIIKDVNERGPMFVSPASVVVMEDAVVGSSVFQVVAEDLDSSDGGISYRFNDGQGHVPFQIGPSDGVVTLVERLNRETIDLYTLEVIATNTGSLPPISSTLNMTVVIGDANDHDPVFERTSYASTFSEATAAGQPVVTVSAKDEDVGLNGEVRYRVTSGDDLSNFLLDSITGELTIRWGLDYEVTTSYSLSITAFDLGQPQRSSTATVQLTVTDIHDFTPFFLQSSFVVYAYEGDDGLQFPVPITQLSAIDRDSDQFSRLTYQLLNQPDDDALPFQINSSSGLISSMRALSKESAPQYSFGVIATDAGIPPNTGSASVRVIVSDANDHVPQFAEDYYRASIVEKMPLGTEVLRINASNALGSGRNAQIRYVLLDDASGRFSIDYVTGLISTRAVLQWQDASSYILVAMATNLGLIPLNATVTVRVDVIDLNDNSPKFIRSDYRTQIRDPTMNGDFIIGITAIDLDDGPNGTVQYSLINGSDTFQIDSNSGVVKAKRTLSISLGSSTSFRFYIRASDQGQPPRSNDTPVAISFLSASTTGFPSFQTSQRNFIISEDVPIGSTIATLSATSASVSGVPLTFSISGGNVDSLFVIDSEGRVKVGRSLDYRKVRGYSLWVEVRDSSSALTSYTMLSINLTEMNRNSPQFDASFYRADVKEQQVAPVDVVVVHAVDSDFGDNGRVTYSLQEQQNNEDSLLFFAVDEFSGQVQTKDILSYKRTSIYRLVVLATDHGVPSRTSSVTVEVIVISVAAKTPPRFTDLFSAEVRENAPLGTVVLRVTSTDPDPGAVVSYSLSSNPNSSFSIDNSTGILRTAKSLDAEVRTEYVLRVTANDGFFNTETAVTVTVLDANDNAPYCQQKVYRFQVVENQSISTFVGVVMATDLDVSTPNHDTFFRLRYPSQRLRVNSSSNSVFTLRAPEFLRLGPFGRNPSPDNLWHVTLNPVDRGMPPLSTECQLLVEVLPENLFSPIFSAAVITAALPSNASPGFEILRLTARDDDLYFPNAEIRYILNNGSNNFDLDPATGALTLKSIFVGRIWISVTAEDGGSPRKSSRATIALHVCPPEAFNPTFVGQLELFGASVVEDAAVGMVVAQVSAIDSDAEDGGSRMMMYGIASGNARSTFAISQQSGVITVAHSIDREKQSVYVLELIAWLTGDQFRQTKRNFTIYVIDVNDNSPKFSKSLYEASVLEDSAPGTKVLQVVASDADSGDNAVIRYSISGDSAAAVSQFAIEGDSGIISTRGRFDPKALTQQYTLVVEASDSGLNSRRSNVTVKVHVFRVNQFAPQFTHPTYQFTIGQSVTVGQSVGTIRATDEDSGFYGTVEYLLVGTGPSGFRLNETTGLLSVSDASAATAASAVDLLRLFALAKNPGPVQWKTWDSCVIVIEGQGSTVRPLVFNQSVYQGTIKEDITIGSLILSILAVAGSGEEVIYSIISGNTNNAFVVDSEAGTMRVQGRLSHVTNPIYNISVAATTSSQSATASVIILVLDSSGNGSQGFECLTSSPCKNGGSCLPVGGDIHSYGCVCSFGSRGSDCGVSGRGFQPLAYIQFSVVINRTENDIGVEIATNSNRSLILYYVTGDQRFLAIEIIEGLIRFSFGGGGYEGGMVFQVTNPQYVSDGQWYRVEATRETMRATVKVSGCQRNRSECDPCEDNDRRCSTITSLTAASSLILGSVDPVLLLGGVRDFDEMVLSPSSPLSSYEFIGCMRNVSVDGYDLLQIPPNFTNLTSSMCQRSSGGFCQQPNPCMNGGKCVDEWFDFRCQCREGFSGRTCADAFESVSLGSGSGLMLKQKEEFRRNRLLTEKLERRRKKRDIGIDSREISFDLRTNETKGMLFYSKSSSDNFTLLQIDGGNVVYWSGSDFLRTSVDVSDSSWHNVTLLINVSGLTVSLSVDKVLSTQTFLNRFQDPLGIDISAIFIGNSAEHFQFQGNVVPGFTGCLGNFQLDGQTTPFSGSTDRFDIVQLGTGVQLTCDLLMPPVTSSATTGVPPWRVPVIVVCALVGMLLLVASALLFIWYSRRNSKKTRNENGDSKSENRDQLGIDRVAFNGSCHGVRGQEGQTTSADLEMSNLEHEKQRMDERRRITLSMRPDVVVPEAILTPTRWVDDDDDGFDNVGYSDEAPERYDIDNASSIAPSDLADVVAHYKRYRNGTLSNTGGGGGQNTKPTAPLTYRPGVNASSHLVKPPLPSHKWVPNGGLMHRISPSKHPVHPSPTSNVLDKPGFRMTGLTKVGGNVAPVRPPGGSVRSTPLSGISELFPSSSTSSASSPPRHHRKTTTPVNGGRQGPLSMGLTLDDINRLTSSNRGTPAINTMDNASMSSGDNIPHNVINTTDFTHDDLFQSKKTKTPPVIAIRSSMREEEEEGEEEEEEEATDDTFTCSEFDVGRRPRNDFTNPNRLLALAPPPSMPLRMKHNSPTDRRFDSNFNSTIRHEDSLSAFLMSEDDKANAAIFNEGRLNLIALNDNYFLNWGQNYERLVGVCIEIGQLPAEVRGAAMESNNQPSPHLQSRNPPSSSVSPSSTQIWHPRSRSNPQFKNSDRRRSPVSPSSQNWNFRSTSNPQFHRLNSKWPPTVSPNHLRDAEIPSSKYSIQSPDSFAAISKSTNPQAMCSATDRTRSRPSSRSTPKSPLSRSPQKSPLSRSPPKPPSPRICIPMGQNYSVSSPRLPEDDERPQFQKLDSEHCVDGMKEEYV